MSEQKNDGGPAFIAAPDPNDPNGATYGASVRDWFAGQALAGMLANPDRVGKEVKFSGWAQQAYFFADAMLAERSKP